MNWLSLKMIITAGNSRIVTFLLPFYLVNALKNQGITCCIAYGQVSSVFI